MPECVFYDLEHSSLCHFETVTKMTPVNVNERVKLLQTHVRPVWAVYHVQPIINAHTQHCVLA